MRVRGSTTSSTTSSIFTKGSTVEVTSDEEGFTGAWFEATVVHHKLSPRKKNKKILVQYKTIVSEENGTKPLREYVNVNFVRPVPPPVEDKLEGFELNDVVDAFHKDGWWTGVVTRVLEDSRYQVSFENPPDELEVGLSDLRFHQKWVKGKWVRPEKQRTGSLMFSVGKKVEVSFDKKSCREAWFPATILEDSGNGSFLVEYSHSDLNDEVVVEKVTVDSLHIRPCPPLIKINEGILEKVDAYYSCAWWSGVITRVLPDSRYIVYFKSQNELKELAESELRPHVDWKDGKWSTASQVSIPSDCQTNQSNATSITQTDVPLDKASTLNEITEERRLLCSKHVEDLDATPLAIETSPKEMPQSALSNSDDASLQPLELAKEVTETPKISPTPKKILQEILQKASQPVELAKEGTEAPKMPLEACKLRAKTTRTPRTPRTPQTSRMKNPIDYPSPDSESSQLKISVPVNGNEGPDSHFQKRTSKRGQELGEEKSGKSGNLQGLNSTPKSTKRGSKSIAIENAADATQKSSTRKETDVPVILGLECSKVTSSRAKRSLQVDNGSLEPIEELKQRDTAMDGIQERKNLSDGESSEKKKRGWPKGKPRKTPISTPTGKKGGWPKGKPRKKPISPPTGMEQSEGSLKDESSDLVDLLEVPIAHTGKRTRTSLTKMSNEKVVQSSVQQHEKHYIKRGKRQRRSTNIESQSQGSGDVSRVKTTETIRISSSSEEVLAEAAHNYLDDQDDQPLAKWFEERQSQTSVDGSRFPPACSPKQSAEMGEKQDMPTQTAEMGEKQDMPNQTAEMGEKQDMPTQTAEMGEKQDMPTQTAEMGEKQDMPTQTAEMGEKQDMLTQTAVNLTLTTQTETPSLPFVKNTLLWATVESMDIFRRIPQKPHFRPLEHSKENSREGQAIGCMVTFSSIAEKISSLHYNDPRSTINEILETLNDLENHGFDVELLRDRLNDLLLMKVKMEKLEAQAADIDDKIIKRSTDGRNYDVEIEEIKAKLSLAISRKEVNDRELDALRSQLGDIQAGMKNALNEFEGFSSKPL